MPCVREYLTFSAVRYSGPAIFPLSRHSGRAGPDEKSPSTIFQDFQTIQTLNMQSPWQEVSQYIGPSESDMSSRTGSVHFHTPQDPNTGVLEPPGRVEGGGTDTAPHVARHIGPGRTVIQDMGRAISSAYSKIHSDAPLLESVLHLGYDQASALVSKYLGNEATKRDVDQLLRQLGRTFGVDSSGTTDPGGESKAAGRPYSSGQVLQSSGGTEPGPSHAGRTLPVRDSGPVFASEELHRLHTREKHRLTTERHLGAVMSGNPQDDSGDYLVYGPPFAFSETTPSTNPVFTQSDDGVMITHRAMLGTVQGSTAFQAIKWAANPGVEASAPWVSAVAQRFEWYKYDMLRFKYVPRVATTSSGDIGFSSDFNPGDTDPPDMKTALASEYSVDTVVWKSLTWPELEVKDIKAYKRALNRKRLVRSWQVGRDVATLYDAATVYFLTEGTPNGTTIGDIWVEYSVRLYQPHIAPITPPPTTLAYFNPTDSPLTSGEASNVSFVKILDPFGIVLDTGIGSGNSIRLPHGLWDVTWRPGYTVSSSTCSSVCASALIQGVSGSAPSNTVAEAYDSENAAGASVYNLQRRGCVRAVVTSLGSTTVAAQLMVSVSAGTIALSSGSYSLTDMTNGLLISRM